MDDEFYSLENNVLFYASWDYLLSDEAKTVMTGIANENNQ